MIFKLRIFIFAFLSWLVVLPALAQKYFPENGPANPSLRYVAITGATIVVDAVTRMEGATLLVKNGKIEAIGKGIAVPKGAQLIDMSGKFIYPAFIDLYTNYGMQWKPTKSEGNENQFVSSKSNMPYGWNEAIRAELNAVDYFASDKKDAEEWHKKGIATVATHITDGISRGTGCVVATATKPAHEAIISPRAFAGLSFQKGSSQQPYPSSLMGSIALLRQTYFDAQWHAKQKEQQNITLDAFAGQIGLKAIFDARNVKDILRANAVAKEFNQPYIIKGNGDEYRQLVAIKETGLPLIVPVNFPKPFDIKTPLDAEAYSTTDLMHWEMAPYNLAMLKNAGIAFCITSQGCESASVFFKNLLKAKQNGINENELLKALTETPAKLINIWNETGSLQKGKLANFIITDQPLFEEKTTLLETWSMGERYIQATPRATWDGKYTSTNPSKTFSIEGNKLKVDNITYTFKPEETGSPTVNATVISAYASAGNISWRLDAKVVNEAGKVEYADVRIFDSTGTSSYFTANSTGNDSTRIDSARTEKTISRIAPLCFPFTDYGWTAEPQQQIIIFKNTTVWTSEKEGILMETDVAIKGGKIVAIGKNLSLGGAKIIDATGKHLTAGIIDEHSHIAIENGVNEGTQAVTAEVRIGDAVDHMDINIYRQLAGGVVAAQLLHGSANPIGGQSALIKLRWGFTPEQMKIAGAAGFIKFALGENVKQSNWGDRATVRYPQTRMGVEQVVIDAFTRAREYEKLKLKRTDLELEALLEILNKNRFISCHSYVQSEINMLMHVCDSFGFNVNTFTHILEGYKVADKMKTHGVYASTFADWWAYKYEVIEAIPYNAAILSKMGVLTAINSDDAEMGRRLNHEAAKIVKYGNINEVDAWNMVTINPATMLHIDNITGSIKVGKDADLVLWTDNPLSVYARVLQTYVDGRCLYDSVRDVQQRTEISQLRMALISRMIEAVQGGEATSNKRSRRQMVYHCDTETEEMEELLND